MTIELPQVKPNENIFNPVYTCWFYCKHCWDRYEQVFIRDDGNDEVYECPNCKQENRITVR